MKNVFKNLFSGQCEKFRFSEKFQKVLDYDNQGCIAVKNLFEFSIEVKFFRTTAREVKDKFFQEKLNYNFPLLSK